MSISEKKSTSVPDRTMLVKLAFWLNLAGFVRRRMIWNIRGDFGAEVIGSSGLGYAALR